MIYNLQKGNHVPTLWDTCLLTMFSKRVAHSRIFPKSDSIWSSVCCHVVESNCAESLRYFMMFRLEPHVVNKSGLVASDISWCFFLEPHVVQTGLVSEPVWSWQVKPGCSAARSFFSLSTFRRGAGLELPKGLRLGGQNKYLQDFKHFHKIHIQGAWLLNLEGALAKIEMDVKLGGGTAFSNMAIKSVSPWRSKNLWQSRKQNVHWDNKIPNVLMIDVCSRNVFSISGRWLAANLAGTSPKNCSSHARYAPQTFCKISWIGGQPKCGRIIEVIGMWQTMWIHNMSIL